MIARLQKAGVNIMFGFFEILIVLGIIDRFNVH